MRIQPLTLVPPLLVLGLATSCNDDDDHGPSRSDLPISSLLDDLGLSTLATAVEAAGLTDDLAADGPFTLFAPTNEAFDALPPGVLSALLDPSAQATLEDLLLYHVVDGEVRSDAAAALSGVGALNGDPLVLDVVADTLFVNDGAVVQADQDASNGVIHVIDAVLTPPADLVQTLVDRRFDTLVAAVTAAELDDDLSGPGPFTVLAPTEEAFAALPPGTLDFLLEPGNQDVLVDLLTYHVVAGDVRASDALLLGDTPALNGALLLFATGDDGASVSGAPLRLFNVPCSNGTLHVLDAVLDVPADVPTTADEEGFTTLVTALMAAELDDDLAAPAGPFTVFAPTDAAFGNLPPGTLDTLLEPANQDDLIAVLSLHVVATDSLNAVELGELTSVTTLGGSVVSVERDDDGLLVGGARVLTADVLASNGLVHAIDAVLLP